MLSRTLGSFFLSLNVCIDTQSTLLLIGSLALYQLLNYTHVFSAAVKPIITFSCISGIDQHYCFFSRFVILTHFLFTREFRLPPQVDETSALLGYSTSRLLASTTGCVITQKSLVSDMIQLCLSNVLCHSQELLIQDLFKNYRMTIMENILIMKDSCDSRSIHLAVLKYFLKKLSQTHSQFPELFSYTYIEMKSFRSLKNKCPEFLESLDRIFLISSFTLQ